MEQTETLGDTPLFDHAGRNRQLVLGPYELELRWAPLPGVLSDFGLTLAEQGKTIAAFGCQHKSYVEGISIVGEGSSYAVLECEEPLRHWRVSIGFGVRHCSIRAFAASGVELSSYSNCRVYPDLHGVVVALQKRNFLDKNELASASSPAVGALVRHENEATLFIPRSTPERELAIAIFLIVLASE